MDGVRLGSGRAGWLGNQQTRAHGLPVLRMNPPAVPPRRRAVDAEPDEVRVVREQTPEPRLPHDRDESADSQQQAAPDAMARKAHDDAKAGRVDTDRGPVLEELNRRLPSQQTPAPKRRAPRR